MDDQERQAADVAHISVNETGFATGRGWRAIAPGMAVVAEIKTGQRRIIDCLLSPLLRYKDDAGRKR